MLLQSIPLPSEGSKECFLSCRSLHSFEDEKNNSEKICHHDLEGDNLANELSELCRFEELHARLVEDEGLMTQPREAWVLPIDQLEKMIGQKLVVIPTSPNSSLCFVNLWGFQSRKH